MSADCERLRDLSRSMLAAARDARWQDLRGLEEERRAFLDACKDLPAERQAFAGDILREVIAIDREVIARSEQARDAAGHEVQGLQKGRRAAEAYLGSQR